MAIGQMTVEDRLRLMEQIWDSLQDEVQRLPIPDSHREELERRMQRADDNPEESAPWEEVKARLWTKV